MLRPLALLLATPLLAATPDAEKSAEITPFKWSGKINVPDPTSVTVDEAGNVYVASTTRRKAADLDIRENLPWVPFDVALTSPEEKLAFYQRELPPGKFRRPRGSLKDHNGDGSVDWKDLEVPKERIYKLTDTDGDGVADKVTVFAEGFNTPVSGIAAGVLYFDGWVYVTVLPDLWRLKDTDGDGVADVKEVVAHGFGAHIAYAGHDMHGLRLGPDGRIYWTIGDKGVNVVSKEGRRFFYPHEGCVLRCEPDGTGFEVFAHGIRNLQEIAFDDFGNIIGVDNDADQPGERERLVYLLEGSDSGWRCQHQYQKTNSRWIREDIWLPAGRPAQPLFITPPIANYSDGPAGFLREPGHALDGTLRGHFFLDQFPKGKMDAFTLEPEQDSFAMKNLRVVSEGIMGIGMAWGTDGRAYFADWEGGYPLDGKGAVWRFDVAPHVDTSSARILSKPFSESVPKDELIAQLGHRDQRVRVNASIRLARLGAWSELMSVARDPNAPRFARIHAVWGWGMGLRQGKVAEIRSAIELLADADEELRVQTLKVLSESKTPFSAADTTSVVAQLKSKNPRLRTQAGVTIGKLALKAVAPADFLQDATEDLQRPWLRHGLVSGLAGSQPAEALLTMAQDRSESVATFGVLALGRQKSPLLARLLVSPHLPVALEAARAIHDDAGIPEAWPALAELLGRPGVTDVLLVRRSINANVRLGAPENAARVLDWFRKASPESPLALEALQALLTFDAPPVLDAVDGVARPFPPRDREPLAKILRTAQAHFLSLQQPSLRAAAFELMVKYHFDLPFKVLLGFAEDSKSAPAVRIQTLRLLAARTDEAETINRTLQKAAADGNPSDVRIEAFSELIQRNVMMGLEVGRAIIGSKSAKNPEKQAVIAALRELKDAAALKMIAELAERLAAGKMDAGLRLDVYLLAQSVEDPVVKASLDRYLAQSASSGKKMATAELPYELLVSGGDASRGKLVVNENLGANCTACHRVDSDEGSEVGPLLKLVGAQRTSEEIAESLVNPSAKIVPGFGLETLVLKSGTTFAGAVLKEDAGVLELRLPDGSQRTVKAAEIAERTPPISIMPPMLGILTPAEIRDVVAYLSGLKGKKKTAKK